MTHVQKHLHLNICFVAITFNYLALEMSVKLSVKAQDDFTRRPNLVVRASLMFLNVLTLQMENLMSDSDAIPLSHSAEPPYINIHTV